MMVPPLTDIIGEFRPISLREAECVKLMTRTDQKYLCTLDQLPCLLNRSGNDYSALENHGTRMPGYRTVYWDTPDHRMYLDHHNGKLNRYKIRIREYLATGEIFLEIKLKDNLRNTQKKRIPMVPRQSILAPDNKNFITLNSPFDPRSLEPVLISSFSRITLISTENLERITIDINTAWHHGNRSFALPGLAVIEVKSAKPTNLTEFGYQLRELRILPERISKYCIGTALLYPNIKHNRFKAKLLHLKKLDNTLLYDE